MTKRPRTTSIHRHLAGVGAFITGVVGGLFLLVLVGVTLETSRSQVLERSTALGSVLASNLTASIVCALTKSSLKTLTVLLKISID